MDGWTGGGWGASLTSSDSKVTAASRDCSCWNLVSSSYLTWLSALTSHTCTHVHESRTPKAQRDNGEDVQPVRVAAPGPPREGGSGT